MSDRDELATIIGEGIGAASMCWEHIERAGIFDSTRAVKVLDGIVDALDAAGYRKPRTITTVEELKTVYAGCLIRESGGDLWSIDAATDRLFMIVDGADVTYDDDILALPATVLYEPLPDCCTADGPTCATCASYAAEDAEPLP